uniref:Uncharacterized protein n=1 Tax=Glossina palpalis gambiensis TaxID=67801 RepID=A0A1B0B9Y5_9MUSC
MEKSSRATSLRSAAVKKVAEQQNDKLILTSRHVTSDCPAEECPSLLFSKRDSLSCLHSLQIMSMLSNFTNSEYSFSNRRLRALLTVSDSFSLNILTSEGISGDAFTDFPSIQSPLESSALLFGGYKFITRTYYSTNSISSFNNTFAIVVYNIAAAKFNFALERRRIGTTGSVLLGRRGTQRAQLVQRTAFTWPLLCLQRPPLRRFFVFNERNMEKIRHHTKTR